MSLKKFSYRWYGEGPMGSLDKPLMEIALYVDPTDADEVERITWLLDKATAEMIRTLLKEEERGTGERTAN